MERGLPPTLVLKTPTNKKSLQANKQDPGPPQTTSTHLIGHDALMGRPPASGLLSTVQVVGSDMAETGNLSREQQPGHAAAPP